MTTTFAEHHKSPSRDTGRRVVDLLRSLRDVRIDLPVDQLTHVLQAASRAEKAGAPDELVVAALCHDVGKVISVHNHGAIAAEILKPFVSSDTYQVIRHHEEFRYRDYPRRLGFDPDARLGYRQQPWFSTAVLFADEWDRKSFDPRYPTRPLEHFEPLVYALLRTPITPNPATGGES